MEAGKEKGWLHLFVLHGLYGLLGLYLESQGGSCGGIYTNYRACTFLYIPGGSASFCLNLYVLI